MWRVTPTLFFLAAFSRLFAHPDSGTELRAEVERLATGAKQEPPLLALDTLLRTATLVKPYAPQESRRILRLAIRHASRHRNIKVTAPIVRMWIDLDPANAETELRKLSERRLTLQLISAVYRSRKESEPAAQRALEALQLHSSQRAETAGMAETVAEVFPSRIPELLLLPHLQADPGYAATVLSALDGLIRAAKTQPEAVLQAAAKLEPLIQSKDFETNAPEIITSSSRVKGTTTTTSNTKATLLESLDLARRIADTALRPDAQAVLRARSINRKLAGPNPLPIDADLPLHRAIEEARNCRTVNRQLAELFRYLQGKPRPAEEAKSILLAMSAWTDATTGERADPVWFFQSLLHSDGQGWQLPLELRPMLFLAAAKAGQQMDRAPDSLMELSLAMAKDNIAIPATLPSVRNRIAFDAFRRALESSYDFVLTDPDGRRVSLQSLRGKAVLLNFWAIWCAPCRAEMPMLERVAKEFGKDLEILAITDDPAGELKTFLAAHPLSLRVLMDQPRNTFEHYKVSGIPQSFLIDPDVQLRHHFPDVAAEDNLRALIAAAIKAKPAQLRK